MAGETVGRAVAEHVAQRARERQPQRAARRERDAGLRRDQHLRVRLRREPGDAHLRGEPLPRARRRRDLDRADGVRPRSDLAHREDRLRVGEAAHRLPGAEPDEARTGWSNATLTGVPALTCSQRPRRCAVGVVIVKRRVSLLPTSQPA